ncbi:MAG: peptidoglycan-binding protein [Myxococcales bacterium]|nr:peptidoglycan-binding protein [Myxococcales bacterium]
MTTVHSTTARPSSSSSASRLQRGASGPAVQELQQLLKSLGLYTANVDGRFGPVTDAAVRGFQRRQGLTVDGWAGPQTMAKLRAVVAARTAPRPPAAPPGGPRLVVGARGEAVKELQQRLQALGLYAGAVGGNFGPATEQAVKAFQRQQGLTVDGWAGPQTMAALRNATGSVAPTAPTASTASTSNAARLQSALDFGMSHLGAPYVGGGSPFRFGRPGDGRVYQMQGQRPYRSPQGVIGFDCSGLVVSMFRRAGVDLAARGLASSSTMKNGLPAVPKSALQKGDLLVTNGHVVVYLGNGKVLEATSDGDPDGDGLGNGSVRVSDASKYLDNPSYVGRRVPL